MIIHSRIKEYQDCMEFAASLAKTHDCKFYVYDMDGTFQCTPTRDADRKLMGEVYPGGRSIAWGLTPGKVGGIRL